MKNNNSTGNILTGKVPYKHFLWIMRTTFILLFTCVFCSMAEIGHTQNARVTINKRNSTLGEVLTEIEKQTDYLFIYNDEINTNEKISVRAKQEAVSKVLNTLLKNKDMDYSMEGNHIILSMIEKATLTEKEHQADIVQQQKKQITGTITDVNGTPIIGANVVEVSTTNGTVTNVDGNFSLGVENDAVIRISYIGYFEQVIKTEGETNFNIILQEDTQALDELVVVGYGTQRKVTLTGAIAHIESSEIIATKNENVQNMLTGKMPGVRVAQKTSEPGIFSNDFDIRGFGTPLLIIDGIPRDNVARLDPNDIESISVLKDASAAVYGVRAANGVVLITTKRGRKGELELKYTGNYGIQRPSGLPKTIGAVDWFALVNEKHWRTQGITNVTPPPHSQQEIDEYRNGIKPSIDWYPHVIQNEAPQSQHSISASGSTEIVNYYISMGYMYQEGFFKSGDMNYERYNVRSNITANITDNLSVDLQLSGIMDERNAPFTGTWEVFKALWRQNPIESMYANNNPEYLGRMASGTNAIALMDAGISGYQRNKNSWFQSSFGLTYKFPFVEGLTAKGLISYDYRIGNNKSYQREYFLYSYNESDDLYNAHTANSPSRVRRSFSENPASLLQASLNYTRSFNEVHNINALLLYEEQTRNSDYFFARRDLALTGLDELFAGKAEGQQGDTDPNNIYKFTNKGLIGRLNYDYASKYLTEFSFRYDGSSKFPERKQWGLFPAVSLAWRVSEESFMKDAATLDFIDNMKLRGSYGIMGDDGALAYQFITGYNFPASRGGNNIGFQGGTVFDGNFVSAVGFKNLPNPNITWFEVKTMNIGLDVDMWKGLLGIEFDLFKRNREGLMATRRLSLPGSLGAALPQENMNSDQVKGMEILLKHKNRIGGIGYNLSGNFSLTRTRLLNYDQAEAVNSYNFWRNNRSNRYNDILWGYKAIGQFQSYEEIYNSDVYYGPSTLPGDFKYLDWNGDGVIDDNDVHQIANNDATPKIYFGLSAGLNYKKFDLNLLFQGATMVNISYPEQLMAPLAWNGSALDYFMDRWHTVDPLANPFDPSTEWIPGKYPYTGSTAVANSTFHLQDASYLRLKSLEIGYTLPDLKGIKNARIYINGYNLLTWSGINYVDPEHPADTYGYIYPLNKTFNIGINMTF